MAKGQHATAIIYLLSDVMLSIVIALYFMQRDKNPKKGRNYSDRNRIRKHAAE